MLSSGEFRGGVPTRIHRSHIGVTDASCLVVLHQAALRRPSPDP